MATLIDVPELLEILRLTPPSQNILLVGRHGIGKSEIITSWFEETRKLRVVPFFLGQMSDPGDLIGLPRADPATGRSVFLPPFWWPEGEQPIVLFLDELNRARPELLQAIQDLTLNRTLAGRRLPDGSVVVAAVNDGEEYQITDLDPALVSRFNVYTFRPTVEDWIVWAQERRLDPRVVAFIQAHPHQLDGLEAGTADKGARSDVRPSLEKTPDRRAWVKVAGVLSAIEAPTELHFKLIAGIVGMPAALALRRSITRAIAVTVEEVLFGTAKERKKTEALALQELALLSEQIVHYPESGRCPPGREGAARKGLLDYLTRLERMPAKREAVAHITSLLEHDRFARAMAFVAESADLLGVIERYIAGIRVD